MWWEPNADSAVSLSWLVLQSSAGGSDPLLLMYRLAVQDDLALDRSGIHDDVEHRAVRLDRLRELHDPLHRFSAPDVGLEADACVAWLVLAVVGPAAAAPAGADGGGAAFGAHISEHAITMGGFNGTMNPGVMHQGFAGFAEYHS